jgi:ABC-type transport system involved in cytochrome c biogenesis permease subunit
LDGHGRAQLRTGGVVGSTLTFITTGAIILGVAHLIETLLFNVLGLKDVALGEFIHRVIVISGFLFLTFGIQGLGVLRRQTKAA